MIKNSVGVSRSDGAATMTYEANKEYNSSEAWQEKVFKYFVKNGLANEIGGNAPVPETKAPKRARNEKGQLKGDDPTTPNVNEAWEGGKAPQK